MTPSDLTFNQKIRLICEARKHHYPDDEIAQRMNLDRDSDEFLLADLEAERDADPNFLRAGTRIRTTAKCAISGWRGEGTMTSDQDGSLVYFRPDGAPTDGNHDHSVFIRDQVIPIPQHPTIQ